MRKQPGRTGTSLALALLFGTTHAQAGSADPAAAPPAQALTIEQCMARARQAGPAVVATRLDQRTAWSDSIATSHNRRPTYSLIGGALIPSGYDPIMTNYGDYHVQARAEWPLRDGGVRSLERQRSAIALDRASIETSLATRDAAVAAAHTAIELLRLDESVRLRETTLAWVQRLAQRMAQGVRAGAHGHGDEQRVLLARDALSGDLLTLREAIETTRRELRRQLDLAPDSEWSIAPPPDHADRAPTSADSVTLLHAVLQSPEARAADLESGARRLEIEEARRKGALEVDLAGDAGLLGSDVRRAIPDDLLASNPDATFSDRLRRDLGVSVGIELKQPVLDAARPSRIRAREDAASASTLRAAILRSERARFGYDLLTHWRVSAARLDSADASVARAEQHVLRLESLFAGGDASLLELLDARQVLDEARGRGAEARADLRRARYEAEAQ